MNTKKIATDLKGVIGCAQEAEFAFRVSGIHDDADKANALKKQGVIGS